MDSEAELNSFQYQRLRAPKENGGSLQVPPLSEVDVPWAENQKAVASNSHATIGEFQIGELQELGRRELLDLAQAYTRQYLDFDLDGLDGLGFNKIVMSGHQPSLFHPGVWFKNFALSSLGKRFNCLAINMVVDNDICGTASIRYPKIQPAVKDKTGRGNLVNATLGTIPIDSPGPNIPFESREIVDWSFLLRFPERVEKAISTIVKEPLVHRLWSHLVEGAKEFGDRPKLGQAMAMARHRLESELGLKSLELPLGKIATTEAFAKFSKSILFEVEDFRSAYNRSLKEYRSVNKVRSSSHPVPELNEVDGWIEAPFWVWQTTSPQRKRLYVKSSKGKLQLTDQAGWNFTISQNNFVEQFLDLNRQGIALRPRALITTMYSRLILSDLFIHGIGGAKYDQLTDVICKRFFVVKPPQFITLSATMKLPHSYQILAREDWSKAKQLERELKFHPEQLIRDVPSSAETEELIKEKSAWTHGLKSQQRTNERHIAIGKLNDQLRQLIDESRFAEVLKISQKDVRIGEIMASREYSFCLFPKKLIPSLKSICND